MSDDMKLIVPSVLPDELDRGYLGRLMRANGISQEKEMATRLADWGGLGGLSRRDAPLALLLGKVAYGNSAMFVQRHTMSPLRRGITSYLPDLEHGHEQSTSMLSRSSLLPARPGAYFCPDCAREDESFHGLSYWRREHQIPGLFWCPKHGTMLRYHEKSSAFLFAPSDFMDDSHMPSDSWIRESMASPWISRYLAISSYLMERAFPIGVRRVQPILRCRASELGLQIRGRKASSPLLSDSVVENFGREWLATVLPEVADKKQGELLNQMDGVLFLPSSASSVPAYILAMAVLYESAEEAMNAILASAPRVLPRRRRARSQTISRHELRRAYCSVRGDHSEVAKCLSANSSSIRIRLLQMGMPNLVPRRYSLEAAIRSFFLDGKSLAEAAEVGGATNEQLESALRVAGAKFVELLLEMDGPVKGRGSGTRRRLRLTPREVDSSGGKIEAKYARRRTKVGVAADQT